MGIFLGAVRPMKSELSGQWSWCWLKGWSVIIRISPRPPYLNALCVLKSTGLPGKGLANVEPDYRLRGERVVMEEMNRRAKAYKNWDEVLQLISQN